MLESIIASEWTTVKRAPIAFMCVFLVGVTVGWGAGYWYQRERTSTLQETVTRYKIAAGIEKPTARTAMMELTNEELKRKAALLVTQIREFMSIHEQHIEGLRAQYQAKKFSEERFRELLKQEDERGWRQFDSIRVDAIMVDDELRARLSPHVQEKIITAKPHFGSADDPKAIAILPRFVGPFGGASLVFLADELDELGKLQLEKLESCRC